VTYKQQCFRISETLAHDWHEDLSGSTSWYHIWYHTVTSWALVVSSAGKTRVYSLQTTWYVIHSVRLLQQYNLLSNWLTKGIITCRINGQSHYNVRMSYNSELKSRHTRKWRDSSPAVGSRLDEVRRTLLGRLPPRTTQCRHRSASQVTTSV